MTRNLYLGADLSPGTSATNFQELVNAAGQILNEVDQNDFSVRAKGLAQEIRNQNPDLVGLQEAALWRDAPCTDNPLPPSATHVHPNGDFLQLLLDAAQPGPAALRLVVVRARVRLPDLGEHGRQRDDPARLPARHARSRAG